MITKTERTELRSIVRQQFKVLRAEVEQRKTELLADVEEQVTERFTDEDKAWADASHLAHEAVMEANRKVNDAYRELTGNHVEHMYVQARIPHQPMRHRAALKQVAAKRLDAQVSGALLRLQRQEADLLRTLAVGAIESEEARKFLESIPTVGELVPAARLEELATDADTQALESGLDEGWGYP